MMMSTPAVRTSEVTACGFARARNADAAARIRKNQNSSSPKNGMRSSTGTWRRRRNARASARRFHSCQLHSSSNAAGTASSGRNPGAPKRIYPLRTFVVPLPAFSASSRSSGRIGTIILNFFMSDSSGGAPAKP